MSDAAANEPEEYMGYYVYKDDNTDEVYYYNPYNQTSQWDKPTRDAHQEVAQEDEIGDNDIQVVDMEAGGDGLAGQDANTKGDPSADYRADYGKDRGASVSVSQSRVHADRQHTMSLDDNYSTAMNFDGEGESSQIAAKRRRNIIIAVVLLLVVIAVVVTLVLVLAGGSDDSSEPAAEEGGAEADPMSPQAFGALSLNTHHTLALKQATQRAGQALRRMLNGHNGQH